MLARRHAKEAAARNNPPARAREESKRVKGPLIKLYLVEEEQSSRRIEVVDPLVLRKTPNNGINIVRGTIENTLDRRKVCLEIEANKLVACKLSTRSVEKIGLSGTPRTRHK